MVFPAIHASLVSGGLPTLPPLIYPGVSEIGPFRRFALKVIIYYISRDILYGATC